MHLLFIIAYKMSVWAYTSTCKYMLQIIIKTADHIKQIDYECDNVHTSRMVTELIKLASGEPSLYYPKPFECTILTNLYRNIDNRMTRAYILINPADYAEILQPLSNLSVNAAQLPVDADFLRVVNTGLPSKTKYTANHPTVPLPKKTKRKFRRAYSTTCLK